MFNVCLYLVRRVVYETIVVLRALHVDPLPVHYLVERTGATVPSYSSDLVEGFFSLRYVLPHRSICYYAHAVVVSTIRMTPVGRL